MIKRCMMVVLTGIMSAIMCMTAFAGTWKQDNNGWWYDNDNGTYQKDGWFQDPADSKWYFASNSGYILQNTWMGNYYLGVSGAMLTNTTTPDGYKVGVDGVWIPEQKENDPFVGKYYYYSYYPEQESDEIVEPDYNSTLSIKKENGSYYLVGMGPLMNYKGEPLKMEGGNDYLLVHCQFGEMYYDRFSVYVETDGSMHINFSDDPGSTYKKFAN